jgi:hypothetical protein
MEVATATVTSLPRVVCDFKHNECYGVFHQA